MNLLHAVILEYFNIKKNKHFLILPSSLFEDRTNRARPFQPFLKHCLLMALFNLGLKFENILGQITSRAMKVPLSDFIQNMYQTFAKCLSKQEDKSG